MPRILPALLILLLAAAASPSLAEDPPMFAIAIHGGAGVISRATMTPEAETSYRRDLGEALDAGYAVLESGGTSMDAVIAAVKILEDSPLFNAGRGAVFSAEGINELDAAVMDGQTLRAGAVAGVRHVRNPIELARLVMERSPHVLLTGKGAEDFALESGLQLVPRSWFYTERRWQQLELARRGERLSAADIGYYGTVGAVALDADGNLAAATSTGGTTNKKWGRIGDTPLIGAGTYADNGSCAVSATGTGEFFIRGVISHEVSALMKYRGLGVEEAARTAIQGRLAAMGGDGGVIVVDREGNIAMEFNSEGMFRGARDARGRREIRIY
jgi:beta-aspartyl-peptidase (threonine type)